MADPNASRPYTFEDLRVAVKNLDHAEGVMAEAQNRCRAAKSALDSHQKDVDAAQETVDRYRDEVRKIVGNLEK